jgi:membrane dipeptidase
LFRTPDDLEDVSKYPNLFAVLSQRNWEEEDLIKLAGGNILRVFKGVEEVGIKI